MALGPFASSRSGRPHAAPVRPRSRGHSRRSSRQAVLCFATRSPLHRSRVADARGQAVTRVRRASAVVTFSLLSVAATAHAECAWGVWRQSVGAESVPGGPKQEYHGPWEILDTGATDDK